MEIHISFANIFIHLKDIFVRRDFSLIVLFNSFKFAKALLNTSPVINPEAPSFIKPIIKLNVANATDLIIVAFLKSI